MKYLKRFNEGIIDDINRLNPIRRDSDNKFTELSENIIDDFNKNDKDLRKVRLITHNKEISFDAIEVGENYTLSYVFGKYHTVKRDLFSANRDNWDRRIKIVKIPFSLTLRKNSLEKAFNTSRVQFGKCRVEDITAVPNYDRNPNTGNHRLHNEKKDEYYISSDVANKLFNFFLEEYETQYPDLKGIETKSSMDISDIEKGVPVSVKFIHVKSKDGKDLTYQLRKGENETEVRKKLSNMTDKEYEDYWRKRRSELYADSTKKRENSDNITKDKFSYIFKPLNIDFDIPEYDKDSNGYRILVYSEDVKIEFRTRDANIKDKLKKLPKEYDGYQLKSSSVNDAYNDTELKFVTIIYEK